MRKWILDKCMNFIQKNSSYDETKLAEIRYGLESIYILITKTIVIFGIAIYLGIVKEILCFLILYNLIRMPSFGLHATKSWICLLSSSIIFIGVPYLCKIWDIKITLKVIISIITLVLIFKNAPADTYKRPIINLKRREAYKIISTCVALVFIFLSLTIQNQFLSNALLLALVVQSFMISPLVYKIFKLPYNNYLNYGLK